MSLTSALAHFVITLSNRNCLCAGRPNSALYEERHILLTSPSHTSRAPTDVPPIAFFPTPRMALIVFRSASSPAFGPISNDQITNFFPKE
jgi:hypothetical protein